MLTTVANIIHEWIQTHGTSQIEEVVGSLTKQYLSSEHDALKKVVSHLSSRIDKLQAQELELTSQIMQGHLKSTGNISICNKVTISIENLML